MRVVVRPGSMLDLTARMAALDLDGRVPDVEAVAQSLFEVTHDVLRVAEGAIANDDVHAQRRRFR